MAEKLIGLSRDLIIHPGETLKEMLEDKEMSQRELAIRTNVKEPHISAIVKGKKPISVSFAKRLEYALGIDASFWINLQSNYEKELADYEELNEISSEEISILKKIKRLTDYAKDIRLIDLDAEGSLLVIVWRKLLNISKLTHIGEISQSGAYRLASSDNIDADILFTWLRITDLITKRQQLETELNIELLKEKLPLFKALTFEDVETIHLRLKEYLAECGIKFAIAKHFTGAPVQGVIKKGNDGTLSLIMTFRRKYADVFWFTFFHEIGHIINGDIKDRLIDYEGTENEIETQADRFAADFLIDPIKYKELVDTRDFSLPTIRNLCEEMQVPPYILIGRLQREKHIEYHCYSDEKIRYELDEIERKIG
jgi:HTH-type transcriptional regulator/antitoxin HigA